MEGYNKDYLNGLIAKAKKSWDGVDVDSFMNNLRDMETIKCKDLMYGDWCRNGHGYPMQITNVGEDYAYATFDGLEGDPWEFDDKDCQPSPIEITSELLVRNGWRETQYWHEYQDGKNTIQCCLPDMRGRINGIEIEHFKCKYVHQYQHLLRFCGLNELADKFKI